MASVLDLVKHYQHSIEKYPNDEHKVLKCIDKLYNLAVTVQHLQETGVGRTVNALRKEPGDVGQAARALVYKWKVMVAAEESDQEEANNDTSNYNGHENGKDYENNTSESRSKHNKHDKSHQVPKSEERHKHTNGDYGSKRKYHSSEEDTEPEMKKSKHPSKMDNGYKVKTEKQAKSEPSESEMDSQDDSSQSDSDSDDSQSSAEERKPETKIKKEKDQSPPPKRTLSSSRDKQRHDSYSENIKDNTEKHHRHKSSEARHSDKHSSKDKSHSSQTHKSTKENEYNNEKKEHRSSESEKRHKNESSSKHSDKHHSTSSSEKVKSSSSSDKHRSSSNTEKEKSSVSEKQKFSNSSEKHRSSSSSDKHRSTSSSEKPKSNTLEKHKSPTEKSSDKHSSSKTDRDKHKQSSEKEISSDKYKSKDSSSSSKDKHNLSKVKSKEKSSSTKEKEHSHRSEKKHSLSKDTESKRKSESHDDKSSRREEKKSKSKSNSSKSESKSKDNEPKKKSKRQNNDDGIDCGSGASFAEALGMISPAKPKKKPTFTKDSSSPTSNDDLCPAALLAPTAKLAPLPTLEISALPEISPNYRPRPPPKFLPHFNEEDAISAGISSKNQRTKVYSGNKVIGKITTLYEMCVHVLQEHIDALEYTGGVPYEILKPVVDRATPQQLFVLEHYNPYLMEDTDHLWQKFCEKNFRNKKRQEMETWREMYMRCQEEQEIKLKSLTANIKIAQEAKKAPIKQTKMAYVDSVVKPPRNIAKKQAQHGTAFASTASPAARVASLAAAPNVLRVGRPTPVPTVSTSSFKPKKAPLMQKALQFLRGRKR